MAMEKKTSGAKEKLGTEEPFRSYAQHRELPAVDLKLCANNIGVSSKALLPTGVAQNHHRMTAANFVILRLEQAASLRFDSQ